VLDRETAHTKSFEEVRDTILPMVLDEKVNAEANDISNQMAAAVRQSDRQPLEDLAKKFNLELGETAPASATEPVGKLGNTPDLHQILFEQRPGELSQPLRLDSGYVILTVKDILPAHQGTLTEVHDAVLADYQHDKSLDAAKAKASDLAKLVAGGEAFDKAAKSLNLDVKTSDAFARNGSVPDVGTGQQLDAAFKMQVGQTSKAAQMGANWLVYRVAEHDAANPDDFAKQSKDILHQLVQAKQEAAFAAFHTALVDRLRIEGKLTINDEAVKRLTSST
jgi:peptidyl-prolyl cis-trans isomerase D